MSKANLTVAADDVDTVIVTAFEDTVVDAPALAAAALRTVIAAVPAAAPVSVHSCRLFAGTYEHEVPVSEIVVNVPEYV